MKTKSKCETKKITILGFGKTTTKLKKIGAENSALFYFNYMNATFKISDYFLIETVYVFLGFNKLLNK